MLKTCIKCGRLFKGRKKGPNLCPDCLLIEYLAWKKKQKRSAKNNKKL